jgi:NTP pyrophosphatase (non-canonical NTP hydrolase)
MRASKDFTGVGLNDLATVIFEANKSKGFITGWDNMPEKLMLVVTEIAEAMEVYRDEIESAMPIEDFNEEIADVFIRLLDICGSLQMDIERAITLKLAFNRTRPPKHGRKL